MTWDGEAIGVVFTLSLLTLFYNLAHFEAPVSTVRLPTGTS